MGGARGGSRPPRVVVGGPFPDVEGLARHEWGLRSDAINRKESVMDEFARAVVVMTATLAVVVGAAGWASLGWAWGTRTRGTAVGFGAPLALSTGVGLALAWATPQLHGTEVLLGLGVWMAAYIGVAAGARALPRSITQH